MFGHPLKCGRKSESATDRPSQRDVRALLWRSYAALWGFAAQEVECAYSKPVCLPGSCRQKSLHITNTVATSETEHIPLLFLAFFCYKNPGNKLNVSRELRKVRIHLHSSTFVHTAFSNTFVTDRAVISLGRSRPSPHTQNFTCAAAAIQLCIAIVCRLNGLQLCNPCKYMDYYSLTDQIGMEGWDGLVLSLQTVMLLRDKIIVLIMLGKYKFSKTRWIPTLFHEFSPTVFELPDLSGFP